MADGVFNIAKGRAAKYVEDNPNALQIILLKANVAEGTLIDFDNMNLLLGDAGNTEADFTNYGRKTALTEIVTTDDTGDEVTIDVADQTWTTAGGATNNTLTKLIVAIQTGGTDTTLIPLTHHDFAVTTDASDLTAQINASGFYRAS